MLMDIACPAELLRIEQAEFGDGRRLAYLTFLNETDKLITAVSGRMTLLGAGSGAVEFRQICFEAISAPPGEKFTCHLPLDDFPLFDTAEISLEHVSFAADAPWALSTRRLMDCTPPPLNEGPERVALVALAGRDTVCFPERRDALWICVCGRYNRWRWPACRRCGRVRDEVLARFTPARVLKEYQAAVQVFRAQDQQRLIEKAELAAEEKARVQAQKAEFRAKTAKKKAHKKRVALRERRVVSVATGVLVLSLLIWGAIQLFGSLGGEPPENAAPTPGVDYLDAL